MFLHTERVSYETPDRDLEIEIFSSRNFAISYEYNVDFNSIIIITIPCNRIILKINEDIIQISQMNRLPSPNFYPPILSLLCSNIITITIHTIPEIISNIYFLHNIFSLHPIIHFPTTKYLQRDARIHFRDSRCIRGTIEKFLTTQLPPRLDYTTESTSPIIIIFHLVTRPRCFPRSGGFIRRKLIPSLSFLIPSSRERERERKRNKGFFVEIEEA